MDAGPDTTDPATPDSGTTALDELSTEDLRERAFALAAHRHDVGFFWSVITHLPHAGDTEQLDGSPGLIGATVSDAISLWREFTGHGYADAEPLLRAAFIDYLSRHSGTAAAG